MRIKSMHLAVIIMVFIFGSVALTSSLGLWKTTNSKVPAKYKDGDFSGEYNPADIRGSYTFEDINRSFDVPLEDLGKAFGLSDPDKYAAFQCKELEAIYASFAAEGKEVGTGSVKYFVALYKGLPYDIAEVTYLPKSAADILKAKAILTAEQIASIEKYSVEISALTKTASEAEQKPSEEKIAEKTPSGIIKGSTTFKELLDWGVKQEDIEKIINDKMPNTAQIIKEYAGAKAIEFGVLKVELQKLVDTVGN